MQRLQQVVSFFGAEAVLPIPERNPTFLIRKWLLAHKMSATCRLLLCTPGWSSSTVLLESLASEAEKRGGARTQDPTLFHSFNHCANCAHIEPI